MTESHPQLQNALPFLTCAKEAVWFNSGRAGRGVTPLAQAGKILLVKKSPAAEQP